MKVPPLNKAKVRKLVASRIASTRDASSLVDRFVITPAILGRPCYGSKILLGLKNFAIFDLTQRS
jgi:hypothetical protein